MEPASKNRCRALPSTSTSCSLLNTAHLHHYHRHHYHRHLTFYPEKYHRHHRDPMIQFHHHHHHHLVFCPQQNHHLHHIHLNSELVGANPLQSLEVEAAPLKAAVDHGTQMLQEQEHKGFVEAEEDDDEPIFVLTDEWREFFAKSEAKRKLEKLKKQAKRK